MARATSVLASMKERSYLDDALDKLRQKQPGGGMPTADDTSLVYSVVNSIRIPLADAEVKAEQLNQTRADAARAKTQQLRSDAAPVVATINSALTTVAQAADDLKRMSSFLPVCMNGFPESYFAVTPPAHPMTSAAADVKTVAPSPQPPPQPSGPVPQPFPPQPPAAADVKISGAVSLSRAPLHYEPMSVMLEPTDYNWKGFSEWRLQAQPYRVSFVKFPANGTHSATPSDEETAACLAIMKMWTRNPNSALSFKEVPFGQDAEARIEIADPDRMSADEKQKYRSTPGRSAVL